MWYRHFLSWRSMRSKRKVCIMGSCYYPSLSKTSLTVIRVQSFSSLTLWILPLFYVTETHRDRKTYIEWVKKADCNNEAKFSYNVDLFNFRLSLVNICNFLQVNHTCISESFTFVLLVVLFVQWFLSTTCMVDYIFSLLV